VADTPDCEANGVKPCIFDFYNSEVTVLVPEGVSDYRMAGNSEKDVAGFWEVLSKSDYRYVLNQVEEYASRMGLEGWSLYLFVDRLSDELFDSFRSDESEVFKTFLLNQMGISARMGLADDRLMTTVSVKEQLYARLFYKYEGRKYYFDRNVKEIERFKSIGEIFWTVWCKSALKFHRHYIWAVRLMSGISQKHRRFSVPCSRFLSILLYVVIIKTFRRWMLTFMPRPLMKETSLQRCLKALNRA